MIIYARVYPRLYHGNSGCTVKFTIVPRQARLSLVNQRGQRRRDWHRSRASVATARPVPVHMEEIGHGDGMQHRRPVVRTGGTVGVYSRARPGVPSVVLLRVGTKHSVQIATDPKMYMCSVVMDRVVGLHETMGQDRLV